MSKRKIENHYRGRRYAKRRYPLTFGRAVSSMDAERFIEAITMAYCAGLSAAKIADSRMVNRRETVEANWRHMR